MVAGNAQLPCNPDETVRDLPGVRSHGGRMRAHHTQRQAPSVEETAPTTSPASVADVATCPVTLPVGVAADGQDRPFASSALAFGNSQLWVVPIQEDGVIRADLRFVESDGSISQKFGWWRITPGTLTISGRRLDAPAPPLRASVPDGYGSSGFQASGVYFPTEGCWAVTGSVGGGTLTFVTFVVRT